MNASQCFIPYPTNVSAGRADLSLGLRASTRFYGDLVAPGIGGVDFVRRLSWSVAAIDLAGELELNPIETANAIEALALKAHYYVTEDKDDYHYRGKRAFARDHKLWEYANKDFNTLRQPKNYVSVTYRQSTTRTLPESTGLGLTTKGRFFSQFHLTDIGKKLADAFLDQKGVGQGSAWVRTFLTKWLTNPDKPPSATKKSVGYFLGPIVDHESPTQEPIIVMERLNAEVSPDFRGIKRDTQRRRRLLKIFNNLQEGDEPIKLSALMDALTTGDSNAKTHARDISTALKFNQMQHAAVEILDLLCRYLEGSDSLTLKDVVNINEFKEPVETFKKRSQEYLETGRETKALEENAETFAKLSDNQIDRIIGEIVKRDSRICQIVDEKIIKGPLFRTELISRDEPDEEAEDDILSPGDASEASLPKTIRRLHTIWLECRKYV